MSITVINEGDTIRVLSKSQSLPEGQRMEFFTVDELERMIEARTWAAVPLQSREDMMFQTQSVSYKDWMDESEWDEAKVQETSALLPLTEFRP